MSIEEVLADYEDLWQVLKQPIRLIYRKAIAPQAAAVDELISTTVAQPH
jgi:hypothetical protein